ncbi:MAG: TerB family tellurite resistance protein [Thermodesulfobacteriota bacterium]|nr:TerB family tellurite resistance protein [Thermodesulfobacteriota bacterium]
MLGIIKSFFKKEMAIGSEVQSKDAAYTDKVQVATCALLLEMACADNEFSTDEEEHIIETVKRHFSLPEKATDKLIELSERERKASIDLWQFARLIRNNYSVEQKMELIKLIWKVIYVDGILDKHEDYLVHKLAKLLGLDHKQLIDAKMEVLRKSSS